MSPRKGEYVAISVGIFVGAVGLWLGTYDPLWASIGLPAELRAPLTTATSLFALLVSFLLAFYLQQASVLAAITASEGRIESKIAEIVSSIPRVQSTSCQNADEALRSISNAIGRASTVLNTRIAPTCYDTYPPSLKKWDRAIATAVRAGTIFREVVSPCWAALSAERVVELGGKGIYQGYVVATELPAFLNFSVITFQDGTKEVWFGWLMSQSHSFDGTVARSTEQRLVQLFESWHASLVGSARAVGLDVRQGGEQMG